MDIPIRAPQFEDNPADAELAAGDQPLQDRARVVPLEGAAIDVTESRERNDHNLGGYRS